MKMNQGKSIQISKKYKPSEFAKTIHCSVSTLQRWDRDGLLIACRNKTGRRFYTDAHIKIIFESGVAEKLKKEVVGYTLINQRDYMSLRLQKKAIEEYCISRGIEITTWFSDVGTSLNGKRSNFLEMMELVEKCKIGTIIIANQSRLMRFGFEFIELFCTKHGTDIVDLHLQLPSDSKDLEKDLEWVRKYFLKAFKNCTNNQQAQG